MSSTIGSKINPHIFSRPIFIVSFSALLAFTLSVIWLNSNSASPFRADLKNFLSEELIRISSLPPGRNVDAIYVLGGSQKSLEYKYNTAADLFHKKICKKILILSRPGKTEYSPSLGRNLTNDEWSLIKLKEFGVSKEYIEPTILKEGFFGTFAEAKGISSLAEKRRYKSLLLVSAPYHTQRVKVSFDDFLKGQNVSVYVQGSGEKTILRHFVIEFIKLKFYQYFLVER